MGVLKQQKELLSACFTMILNRSFVEKNTNKVSNDVVGSSSEYVETNQKLGVLRF